MGLHRWKLALLLLLASSGFAFGQAGQYTLIRSYQTLSTLNTIPCSNLNTSGLPEASVVNDGANNGIYWCSGVNTWSLVSSFTPAGDLAGSGTSQQVIGFHFGATGLPLGSTAPSIGQCLEYNGTNIGGAACSGGGGNTPGGVNANVQFNQSGAFGGATSLNYNLATGAVTAGANLLIGGPNPYYDALANGMVCDGSTDDTGAFTTLLNTISTGTGYGSIFVPNTNNPCIIKGFASGISSITLVPGSPPGTCTTTSSASTYCFQVNLGSTPPAYVKNGAPVTILGTTGCTRTDTVNGEGCNGTYLVVSVSGNTVYVTAPASGMAGTPSTGSALLTAYPWTNGIVNIEGQCAPRQNVISCSKFQTPSAGELPIYELAMVPCVTAAPLSSTCPAGNATVNAVIRRMNFQGRTTTNNALGGLLLWGINGTLIENNSFQAFVGSGTGCVSNCIPVTPGVPGLGGGITLWGGRIPASGGTSALSNNQNNLFAMDQFSQMTYCITNQGQASGNTLLLEHCIPAGSGNNSGLIANQIGFDFGFTYSQANSNVATTGGENSFYGVQEELGAGGLFLDNTNEIFVGTFKLEQPNSTPYGPGNHGETLTLSVKNSSAVTVYDVQNKNNCTGVHMDTNMTNSRISQTNTTGAVPGYCTGTGNLDGGSYTDASNVSDAVIPTFLNANGNMWSSPSPQSAGSTFSGPGSYTPTENAYVMAANQNFGPFPVNVGNNVISATSPNSSNTRITAFAYNAIPFFHGQESGGTQTSPTATAANAFIAEFVGSAYNGTGMNGPSGMRVFTSQNQTTSNGGSNIDFQTIPNNTTTPATVMELFQDGSVVIGSPAGGPKGTGSLNMGSCFINGVACGTGGGGGTPGGSSTQYQINNAGSFGGSATFANSVAAGTGTVLVTQSTSDIPAFVVKGYPTSPASDVFQVAAKGQSPGNTCSGTLNCSFWIDASNNLNFLGNTLTLGAANQANQSHFTIGGSSNGTNTSGALLTFESNDATQFTTLIGPGLTTSGDLCSTSNFAPSGDCSFSVSGKNVATWFVGGSGATVGHGLTISTTQPFRIVDSGGVPMNNAFPVTVSGATSGGIPYFSSATTMASSSQLCQFGIVQGGGVGGAPTTNNCDFTIDAIAHQFSSDAAGIVNFSPSTTPMRVPSIPASTTTADAQVSFDNSVGAKNFHGFTNSADSLFVTVPVATAVNGDCMKWVVTTNNVQAGDTGSACGSGGATALSSISAATAGNTITSGNHGAQNWQWALTSNSQTAWEVGENVASTNGTYTNGIPNQVLGSFYTIAGSTASPLLLTNSLSGSQTACTLCLNPTWSTTGVVDAGIFMNVTNTGSGTGSKLIDLQVGNTTEFNVDKTGAVTAAATVSGTTFIGTAGLIGAASTTAVRVNSGNDTNTVTAPGTLTLRGSNITAGSTASSAAAPALLTGGTNAGTGSSAKGGSVEVSAGSSSGGGTTPIEGDLITTGAFSQSGTVTQYNIECYTGAVRKTVTDCSASPTVIAGVAMVVTSTTAVTVAQVGSTVPVNLSAAGTLYDTVCAGTTAGKLTDSGGTGACSTGITVGVVVDVTARSWTAPDGSTATLSTSLPLVHLMRFSASGTGDVPSVACSALPSLTGDTTTSAGSCATTTAKINGGTVPASAALLSTNGSSQIVAAASSTAPIAVSATGAISITGAAGQVLAGSSPAFTATPTLGTDNSVAGTLQEANGSANAHTIWSSGATTTNTIAGFATAPTTGDLVSCTTSSTTCTLTDSGKLATNLVTASSNAAAANQVWVSGGANKTAAAIDMPERLYVPSANCNNTTAGAGWSIGSGGTVTCRAGTNNLGGYITITDTSSTFAQFTLMIPDDWDTATNPYIRFYFSSATDTTNGHTVIPAVKVSCPTAANGTTSDDATFSASQSSSTVTFGASAVANGFYNGSNVQFNSTSMTGCIAGGMMIVQVGRATDTATGNINFYGAGVTFPRLITVQAN